jgi:hypothetical protein
LIFVQICPVTFAQKKHSAILRTPDIFVSLPAKVLSRFCCWLITGSKNCMFMKRLISLCVLLLLCVITLFAQNVTLTGTVTDENGNPLSGVNVVPKGSKSGTQTNDQGAFTIGVSKVPIDLIFSFIGFGNKTVTADGKTNIRVGLVPEAKESEADVVVIGYQTVKRRDLTSSVSSVSAKDIKDIPVNSTAEALTGRLAGVQITTSEGSPDAAATIRVRGGGSITQDNTPLYVVDGIQV